MSQDSSDSREREPIFIQASDIRRRLTDSLNAPTKSFQRDPEDPSAAALKVSFFFRLDFLVVGKAEIHLHMFIRNLGKRRWRVFENHHRMAIMPIGNYCLLLSSVEMI